MSPTSNNRAASRRPRRWLSGDWRAAADWLALGVCLAALVGGLAVATTVFERLPHTEDELAYLFQARVFASGRLIASLPARPDFFYAPFVVVRGTPNAGGVWFGKYPPGYPSLLALGVLAGQPWLVNPILGAIAVWLTYRLGRRVFGPGTGLLASFLLASSPFFLLQAGSGLGHVAGLVSTLAFTSLALAAHQSNRPAPALGAGVALGTLLINRPLTAAAVALLLVALAGADLLAGQRRPERYLLTILGTLPFGLALLDWNWLTTGSALASAYTLWWPFDRLGFGPDIGLKGSHTLADAIGNAAENLAALGRYGIGWGLDWLRPWLPGVPSGLAFVFVAIGALSARGVSRALPGHGNAPVPTEPPSPGSARVATLWLAGLPLALIFAYLAYWSPGAMFGPRYYFESLGALALLGARGFVVVANALPARPLRWLAPTVLAVPTIATLVFATPAILASYAGFNGITAAGVRVVEAAHLRHALVFVVQATPERWTDYAPFFARNVPTLGGRDGPTPEGNDGGDGKGDDVDENGFGGEVVYAIDRGISRDEDLMQLYPDRSYYVFAAGRLARLLPAATVGPVGAVP